jgi:hypothetical protein
VFDDFLTDFATIRRAGATRPVSTTGTALETWNTVRANVPCSIQQVGSSYQQREPGFKNATRWTGYFHGDADIQINDEIVMADGRKYKVHSAYNLGAHQQIGLVPHEE